MQSITTKSTFATIFFFCGMILVFSSRDCDICYSKDTMLLKLFICGIITIFVALWFTYRYLRYERVAFDIANQPLLDTNEAVSGVSFAGEGTIASENLLESVAAKTPCVYYHSILEKYIPQGKNSYWKIVDENINYIPFKLLDRRGTLLVDVAHVDCDNSGQTLSVGKKIKDKQKLSEIDCEIVMQRKKVPPPVGMKGKFRRSEYVLRPGTKVFLYGYVDKNEKGESVVCESENYPLIVTRKSQKEYIAQFFKGKGLVYFVYLFILGGTFMMLFALFEGKILPLEAVSGIFFIIFGISVLHASVTLYNRIVVYKNRALNALSNIEGELKRRFDLIPNVVAALEGYVQHERSLQEVVALLRSVGPQESIGLVDTNLHNKILASIEAYPNLKASEGFQKLMILLTDTEERIAYSRSFYNKTVEQYNTAVQQFPTNILANLAHLSPLHFINYQENL